MKGMKLFLMVVMIGTMVGPVFAGDYDLDPVYEANRSQLLTSEVQTALKDGAITEEEADLILKTDKLFVITNEQRKQICIEACKWALAKNIDLAKDPTIPLKVRQGRGFIRSANDIKTTPGLKQAFNYDDVDLSLYKGDPVEMERIRQGNDYSCGGWVHDCHFYGYIKVKEKDLRKAADLWGYSFEEFVRRLSQVTSYWIITAGGYKTKPIPPGVSISFPAHAQLSLGEFGYSSNGNFCPDASKATYRKGKKYVKWDWGLPLFENPISKSAAYCSSRGDEIYSGIGGGAQRGVFHLPKHRFSSQSKPWLGIEVKYSEERGLIVTKVYPQSPAEKLGIKEGDRIKVLAGGGIRDVETLERGLEYIALFQLNGKRGHSGDSQIDGDGKWLIISDQEMYVEIREKKDIPSGSY